jgi:hypothetical protein
MSKLPHVLNVRLRINRGMAVRAALTSFQRPLGIRSAAGAFLRTKKVHATRVIYRAVLLWFLRRSRHSWTAR